MKPFKEYDSRKFIFIVGGILIVIAFVVAILEAGGITDYIKTFP